MSSQLEQEKKGAIFDELGSLPSGWKVAKIGELLKEVNVKAKQLKGKPENIPILSMTRYNGLVLQTEKFGKRVAGKDTRNYKVVRKNNIVYSFPMDEGVIYVLKRFEIGLVSPTYFVWEIVDKNIEINFLDSLLRTPKLISIYTMLSSKTVHRRRIVKKDDFKKINIMIPPRSEQEKISSILSTIKEAREKVESVLASLQVLKKSLMKHLFTYGPVSLLDVGKVDLKETELGLIPQNWDTKLIGDVVVSSQYGLSKRAGNIGKYPMLRMNNLVNGSLDLKNLKYLVLDDAEFNKYKLSKGDVLFNRTNSFELVGKTSLFNVDGNYTFGSYIVRLVLKRDLILPEFLTLYINWEKAQNRLKSLAAKAVGQSNISASRLKTFKIPIPPLAEQRQIASFLLAVDSEIKSEKTKRKAIDSLFKSMLNNLMTATIRVPNLET
jgi:type I restriction enzyme S subunit